MPGCMGTAALAHGPGDMSYCTCSAHKEDRLGALEWEVKKLKEMLKARILPMTTAAPKDGRV